jgi:EmrB/QacA subfamily drug resistance transporter
MQRQDDADLPAGPDRVRDLDGAESLLHGPAVAATDPGDGAEGPSSRAPARVRRATLIAVLAILAATGLDTTVISVALPTIRIDLGSSVTGIQWVSSVYMLALALILVPAGRLTDSLGPRRVMRMGLLGYLVSSAAAAAAPDTLVLILARAGQGFAAGLVAPATVVLIEAAFGASRRGRAFGLVAMVLAVASAAGPVVGGAFTDTIGWRAIFVVHFAMALVSLVMTTRAADPPGDGRRVAMDPLALLGMSVVVVGLQLAIIEGGQRGLAWGVTFIAAAAVGAAVLFMRDRRAEEPLVDLSLMRRPPVLAAVLCRVAVSFAFFGNLFYLTLFLQGPAGYSALQTGLILLPSSLVGIASAPLAGRLVDRIGADVTLVVGTAAAALSLFALAVVHETSSVPLHLLPALALNGFGYALTAVGAKVAPLASVAQHLKGRVTALVSVTARLAAGFGVTFATGLFNLVLGPSIGRAFEVVGVRPSDEARQFIVGHIGAADLPATVTAQSAASAGFASADQAVAAVDKAFALSYSLLSGIVGTLVVFVVLGLVVLLRRKRAE